MPTDPAASAPTHPDSPKRVELTALTRDQLIVRYRVGIEYFDRRVVTLADDQLDTAFLPEAGVGRWPCRILLGHLADAELANSHRIRRTIGEDYPVFSVWDENAFIDAGLYGGASAPGPRFPIGGFLASMHTLRQWTGEFLATLPDSAWSRRAMHPVKGELSLRDQVELNIWHLEHHGWWLNRKVVKMLGPAAAH